MHSTSAVNSEITVFELLLRITMIYFNFGVLTLTPWLSSRPTPIRQALSLTLPSQHEPCVAAVEGLISNACTR